MFGNKKKFTASSRFQRRDFRSRVTAARGYKRTVRHAPETPFLAFLDKIGLDSKLKQFLALGVLLGLFYLIFIPNFLFVRDVVIEGASPDSSSVQNTVLDYLNKNRGVLPNRNLVLLNKADLEQYLLKNNAEVLKVDFVRKKLWNSLTVGITARRDRFSLSTDQSEYILYNDGIIHSKLEGDQRFPPGLAHVVIATSEVKSNSSSFFSAQTARTIDEIFQTFPNVTGKVLDYVELPVAVEEKLNGESIERKVMISESQLILFAKKDSNAKDGRTDFRIFYDPESLSISEMENSAKQMLAQLPPERYNLLYYLDLRFKNKAYVCLKNAACAKENVPVIVAPVPVPQPEPQVPDQTKPKN